MDREHILITDIHSNPNVGLYAFATDKYCLLGSDATDSTSEKIAKTLDVPVIKMTVGGSTLVGVFLAGNSKKLLVPDMMRPHELKILENAKIDYAIIKTRFTALGNNILCNDNGCIVSQEFSDESITMISDALDIPVKKGTIAGFDLVGSCSVANSKGCLVHNEVDKKELTLIKNTLKVKVETGTINMGSPYVRSGIIANSKGFIVSSFSGGPEIVNVDEVLGFLD